MQPTTRLVFEEISRDSMLFKYDEDITLGMLSRSNMSDQFAQYFLE
jgi:hypothetical protein